ncbi:MAG: hypothetical protein ACYTGW_16250 [Planctomycetota bacterium]|jgi:hypothetical protein
MQIPPPRLALPLLALLAAPLAAQNLVTNGDFESGNTNGWTFTGYTVNPKVMNFNTTGTGASRSFSNRPGSKATTLPPGGSYTMEQKVAVIQGLLHLLTADIAVANTLPLTNVDAGNFEFWVDGKLLKRVKFGSIFPNQVERRQVGIRFTPAATGQKQFKVVSSRAWGAQPGTPRHHIDNIVMLRTPRRPLICPRGERKIGGNLTVDIYGSAGNRFAVFLAASQSLPAPLPGFVGNWHLPLPPLSVPVLFANFDSTGAHQLQVALTQGNAGPAAGIPLYWQGIEATQTSLSLGTLATFGVY